VRILVAEDDFTSRSILVAILKKWGYDLIVTEDGLAAWEALHLPDAPRLVLLDWDMPGLDGLEVCRRIRAQETPNPPYVILLTGRGEKGDLVRGLETGANDYVTKPYDSTELQARIRVGERMLEMQAKLLEARDTMAHLAKHDPLTGLFNRRAILERLAQEISRAKRDGAKLSVGMFDLDHFKKINDTYGHQTGDDVLVAFARLIQSRLREYDCVGRYGGEEFLVIASGSEGRADERLYERLRAGVAGSQIPTKTGEVSLTVSVGVASGTGCSTVDDLLAAADAALYEAKAAGRNRVAYAKSATAREDGS
jgi:two-component system cell cycle response regulator